MIYNFKKFNSLSDDMSKAREIIEFEKSRMIKFGIDYLDDGFVGIAPNDLILIGGRSGGGKTELALNIAFNAALKKKNVYYFALEAEQHELGMRLLYKTFAQSYFSEKKYLKENVSFDSWISGQMSDRFYKNIEDITGAFGVTENLKIRYSTEDYSIENFVSDMDQVKEEAHLVVLDHLHYFELDETNNENSEYKKIVKIIRSQCLEKNIPVILVSHLRKANPLHVQFCPEQEDFHGSSDIVKISTKAITIGSGANKPVMFPDGTDLITDKFISFMKIVKHRRNGGVTHNASCIIFNQETNSYEGGYFLGNQAYDSSGKRQVFYCLDSDKIPLWAKRAEKLSAK